LAQAAQMVGSFDKTEKVGAIEEAEAILEAAQGQDD
jgi:hypothetical protein